MTDKLTEALKTAPWDRTNAQDDLVEVFVQRWASFPTDADVEAAARALEQQTGIDWEILLPDARDALIAVKNREDR